MTTPEMLNSFLMESGTIDSANAPITADILYWLNNAQLEFIKSRYVTVEKTERDIEDLKSLIHSFYTNTDITLGNPLSHGTTTYKYTYSLSFPVYLYILEEYVNILHTSSNVNSNQKLTYITHDRLQDEIRNPFGEHIYHHGKASPLRILEKDSILPQYVTFITDITYSVTGYGITGLLYPTNITLLLPCALPQHTHIEIVKMAVKEYLENKSNPRQQTISNSTGLG